MEVLFCHESIEKCSTQRKKEIECWLRSDCVSA